MINGKVWGNTADIFSKNNVEIHRISIRKGGYCSKHKHKHKYNAFYIEHGALKVRVWKNDYDLVDEITITAGGMTAVPPGEYHEFEAISDCIAYEIYWTELNQNDIERESVGGIR